MTESILVIDLGTTNIKAVVFDLRGDAVFTCTRPTPFVYDSESMEIDPDGLWRTVLSVCGEALTGGDFSFAAITMSSMAASFIPINADGRPLHPAIGWADARSIPYMREYMDAFLTGSRVERCAQYPLQMYLPFKAAWFAQTHPDKFRHVEKWLNVSEYIYAHLTGDRDYRTDYSIASRTILFDIEAKKWNPAALRWFDIDENMLPVPVPAGTVIGTAGPELQAIGFAPGVPIVMGGHDHMCSVPGAGIIGDDVLLNTTGTSEAVISLYSGAKLDTDKIVDAWLNYEAAMQSDMTAVIGYVGMSGRIYQSLGETLQPQATSADNPPLSAMPVFLPPQRAQLTSVEGELRGLHPIFDAGLVYRSMCDGLYCECRRMMERILNANGSERAKSMRIVGGHTRNTDEVARKSAALGIPLEIVDQANISAVGAAVVAGYGCGKFASYREAIGALCRGKVVQIDPDPVLSRRFEDFYHNKYLPCFENGIHSL